MSWKWEQIVKEVQVESITNSFGRAGACMSVDFPSDVLSSSDEDEIKNMAACLANPPDNPIETEEEVITRSPRNTRRNENDIRGEIEEDV
jgi:hypothetical protein